MPRLIALLFSLAAVALIACGGDDRRPSGTPDADFTPPTRDAGFTCTATTTCRGAQQDCLSPTVTSTDAAECFASLCLSYEIEVCRLACAEHHAGGQPFVACEARCEREEGERRKDACAGWCSAGDPSCDPFQQESDPTQACRAYFTVAVPGIDYDSCLSL